MIRFIFVLVVFLLFACVDPSTDSKDNYANITPEELEKLDSLDPLTNALEIYRGISNPIGVDDGMKPIDCEVYLMAKNITNNKLYFRTSFNHKNISHPYIVADLLPNKLQIFGIGSNNSDTMVLTLTEKNNYRSLTSINLRWTHSSHFHFSNCYRLILIKKLN